MSVLDRKELEQSPLADLHAIASELGVEGYRRLRKEDLIGAILESQGGDGGGDSAPSDDAGTATTVEASGGGRWREQADFVTEAEKLGLDVCWVAEAWGSDAPSAIGYYAARTERMLLGSGIMQLGIRTPAAVAQTALDLAPFSRQIASAIAANRFCLARHWRVRLPQVGQNDFGMQPAIC